ncbi:MAG: hypothetical protein E6Q97_08890 [Desulfurellales bacterium]|nr:MAG: hypothetical protein E6Q97_08890 [Desulfurellales bacterium]
MSTLGYGVGGAVGTGTESTAGTGVAPAVWHQFVAEGFKASRALVKQSSITGDRSVLKHIPGMRAAVGELDLEFDGNSFGQMFWYLNGTATGALTTASVGGLFSSAPTATPTGTGNSVPAGTYRYAIAPIWQYTLDSKYYVGPVSAAVTGVTVTAGQKVDVSWSAASSPPTGWTFAGTAVYRTSGAAGTELLVGTVTGSGTTYADTNATVVSGNYCPVGSAASPVGASVKQHTFVKAFTIGSDPLPSFSTTVAKNNDVAERFLLCKANSLELSIGEGNSLVKTKFGIMCRDFEEVANPTPSYTNLSKAASWQTIVGVNGSYQEIIEKITLNVNNNCEMIPGLSGQARMRDVGYGERVVTGSFDRQFEDHSFWRYMRDGGEFSLQATIQGDALGTIVAGGNPRFTFSSVQVQPLSYLAIFDLPVCRLSEAGSNISGPGRQVEKVSFSTEVDSTTATELKVRLINLTSSYS